MNKKIIVLSIAFSALLLGVSALAETSVTNGSPTTPSATALSCLSTVVSAREAALGTAITAHSQSVNSAYTARAVALHQAYGLVTTSEIRAAIRAAWSAFKTSIKNANKNWKTARNGAWSQFRTAAKACNAPASLSDSSNAGSELSSQ